MVKINIQRTLSNIRLHYLTLNNAILVVALLIGANWAWGSIGMMQRNYYLQKKLEVKQREQRIAELEIANLAYQQQYYESDEYKELAARQYLGLVSPGEKVLILPLNPEPIGGTVEKPAASSASEAPPSNLKQWTNFLLGRNRRNLQNNE